MFRWINLLDDAFAGLALFACFLVVCLEIVVRSVFNISFLWAEELSRYLIIVSTYFGAAAAVRSDDHIRVELLTAILPPGPRRALEFATSLLCAAFTATVAVYGYRWVADSVALDLFSADSSLVIPVYVFQAVVPLGFGIMTARFVCRAFQALSHRSAAPAASPAVSA